MWNWRAIIVVLVGIWSNGSLDARTTIIDYLRNPGAFGNFLHLLTQAKLEDQLTKKNLVGGSFTLFVPINEAVNKFGKVGLLSGQKQEKQLFQFVAHHLVNGNVSRRELLRNKRKRIKTLGGAVIRLSDISDVAKVLYSVITDTGTIHVLDTVLVHPELAKTVFK